MFNDIHTSFDAMDYTIQGRMVICRMSIPDYTLTRMDPNFKDNIKMQMATQIATFMLDNKMIEYTQQRDMADMKTLIAARCFVTPDDTVRILRTLKR